MDGMEMGRDKTDGEIAPEVMDWAVAIAGMMYASYTQRHCYWMAEQAVRNFSRGNDREGTGSAFGEGLATVGEAVQANALATILKGNNQMARRAIRMGLRMPTDEEVYAEAERRKVVPPEWRERAFR